MAGVAWLWASGTLQGLDPTQMRDDLRGTGSAAAAAFVLAIASLQPLGVSIYLFLFPAAFVWSAPKAIALTWIGAVASATVCFLVGRYLAREQVQARLPARIRRYEESLSAGGFQAVLWLRLILYTSPPLQWLLGVTNVRFRPFMAATAVGLLPWTIVCVLAADRLAEWLLG